jgi:hypothetical protein
VLNNNKAALILIAGVLMATSAMAQGKGNGKAGGIGGAGFGASMGGPSGNSTIRPKAVSMKVNSGSGSAPGAKSPVTLLDQNTKLENKLSSFFPDGTDLSKEAAGFKNLGQFVSAVHVSHNLGIPFENLKCSELGTAAATEAGSTCSPSITNSTPLPLSKTIQALHPGVKPEQAIQEANNQSEKDLQESARK